LLSKLYLELGNTFFLCLFVAFALKVEGGVSSSEITLLTSLNGDFKILLYCLLVLSLHFATFTSPLYATLLVEEASPKALLELNVVAEKGT